MAMFPRRTLLRPSDHTQNDRAHEPDLPFLHAPPQEGLPMQRSTVNLNAPPPQFARRQALLVEALRRLGPGVELDDVVIVVKEPELAAERG